MSVGNVKCVTVVMATSSEISIDEIREYLIKNGGKVCNRDLVKYFKKYLTDPNSKEDARVKFKEYVNQLATIKTENDEKYVILRKRHSTSTPTPTSPTSPTSPRQPPPYRPPPQVVKSPTPSVDSLIRDEVSFDNLSQCSEYSIRSSTFNDQSTNGNGDVPPQAPPRRRSQDKLKLSMPNNNSPDEINKQLSDTSNLSNGDNYATKSVESSDNEQKVSVRERTQKFNRLASETDSKPTVISPISGQKKKSDKGIEEDDGASVTSLDPSKTREWVVKAAKNDYQALAKLAAENPRLVRYKDSFVGYTALHWAAKLGNENIVKLLAGTYHADVNARSNGGYTPLHLAQQFGHTNIVELLTKVYNADSQLRDWSGRLPSYYVQTKNQSVSNETFRKIKARRKQSEKDSGFLRIGSLNVRVKKTTEAFSNFLGVGTGASYPYQNDKVHKTWGSADNLPEKTMPPPKPGQIKKRKSKRAQDFIASHSTPGTPNQIRATTHKSCCPDSHADSDSDTACGFDSNWQTTLE